MWCMYIGICTSCWWGIPRQYTVVNPAFLNTYMNKPFRSRKCSRCHIVWSLTTEGWPTCTLLLSFKFVLLAVKLIHTPFCYYYFTKHCTIYSRRHKNSDISVPFRWKGNGDGSVYLETVNGAQWNENWTETEWCCHNYALHGRGLYKVHVHCQKYKQGHSIAR